MTQRSRPTQLVDPAAQAAELTIRLGLFVLTVVTPCAAALSRRTIFSLTPIGLILIIIGALLAPRRGAVRDIGAALLKPQSLALIFLVLWSGLTLAWTPALASGAPRFLKTAGTLLLVALAGALTPPRTKTSNLYLLPVGAGLACVATFVLALRQHAELLAQGVNFDDSTLGRASVGALMLVWPALLVLTVRERWLAAAFVAVAVIAAVSSVGSGLAMAALTAGALALALSTRWPHAVGRILGDVTAAVFLLAPALVLVVGALAGPQPDGLLAVAQSLAVLVKTEGVRLITGHGLDASLGAASAGLAHAGTARSLLFEVWYELGLLGALGAAFLFAAMFRWATVAPAPVGPFLIGALVCGLTLSLAQLNSGQEWWMTLVSVAALLFVMAKRGRYRTKRPRAPVVTDEARPPQPAA